MPRANEINDVNRQSQLRVGQFKLRLSLPRAMPIRRVLLVNDLGRQEAMLHQYVAQRRHVARLLVEQLIEIVVRQVAEADGDLAEHLLRRIALFLQNDEHLLDREPATLDRNRAKLGPRAHLQLQRLVERLSGKEPVVDQIHSELHERTPVEGRLTLWPGTPKETGRRVGERLMPGELRSMTNLSRIKSP